MSNVEIRPYHPSDEDQWLRCRALSFLYTAYYDDVAPVKPELREPSVELVALRNETVVGLLDAQVDGDGAVIETIAVHPDHQGRGVGGRLLAALLVRLRVEGIRTLAAWTRDDPDTLAWYRAMGFTEQDHYVHVHAEGPETAEAAQALVGTHVGRAFLHADLADEEELRKQFRRVYVCRRFVRPLTL